MKKNRYITPETEVVKLRLMGTVMGGLDDLFGGESEPDEDSQDPWVGAKDNSGFFDDPFGSLWDDDPVEDPFSIDD